MGKRLTNAKARALAERIAKAKLEAAALYRDAGEAQRELDAITDVGDTVVLPDGTEVTKVDPFIDKKTGKPCTHWARKPIDRFDFEVTPPAS